MQTSASVSNRRRTEQQGFTILELMIATMVFSVILLVVAAGILSFTKQYVKGITTSKTQTVARAVMADVVQNIQFSGGQIGAPNTISGLSQQCIGNIAYYYQIGQQVDPTHHGLIKDIGSCNPDGLHAGPLDPATQHEMLGRGMRLAEFSIQPAATTGATVTISVVSGDNDLFIDGSGKNGTDAGFSWSNDVRCRAGAGSQFCGISRLTTFVQTRIEN